MYGTARERELPERERRRVAEAPPPAVIALQRTAGNAAVTRWLARRELRDYEVADEIASLKGLLLSDASIRSIQLILETDLTGEFTAADVQALVRLHTRLGLNPRNAMIGRKTLDALVRIAAARQMEEEAIHLVADFYKVGSAALSIRYSPTLLVPSMATADPAGMRFVAIGKPALESAGAIRKAIDAALADASPAPGATAPPVLQGKPLAEAVKANAYALRDQRSVIAVQHATGAAPSGFLDEDAVQSIAAFQQARQIAPADGILGDPTFDALVTQLGSTRAEDAAIRLVIDYRGIDQRGVMDVSFDPAQADEVKIHSLATRAAASITFGSALFGQPVERIVHRIARAFADVDLRHRGIPSGRRAFLLERFTMLSPGMPEEEFTPFMADAVQALAAWKALDADAQKALAAEFAELRDRLRERWGQAPAALQQPFQPTFDEFMALPLP
jgi:hypothetical protein